MRACVCSEALSAPTSSRMLNTVPIPFIVIVITVVGPAEVRTTKRDRETARNETGDIVIIITSWLAVTHVTSCIH